MVFNYWLDRSEHLVNGYASIILWALELFHSIQLLVRMRRNMLLFKWEEQSKELFKMVTTENYNFP